MKAASVATLKQANRHAIMDFIYHHHDVTKQTLERELGLSLPTITSNLRTLGDEGLVGPGTLMESTGGRKAQTYELMPSAYAAIGVSARASAITMVAIDLRGTVLARKTKTTPYRDTDAYYSRLGALVTEFANTVETKGSHVLGVAFSIQGIVSAEGTSITFGQIVGNTGLTLERLSQGIHLPTIMIHDSDASALAELWFDPSITDAVCVYLERRPGGAVIVNGQLYRGPNLCNGTIEHMTIVPGGEECYCGQHGCMDTVCSPETLMEDGESLPGFFSVLEQGERGHRRRFDAWLGYVAQSVANIRAVLAGDIIIGGEAAQYLDDRDLADLKHRIEALSPFPSAHFTLRKSSCADDQNTIGAALCFIQPYVNQICGRL
ncbi:ROK family transcriptional regulator [Bifidobacterium oedipodis]|uniref:NagC family transcriptional regulator n=1 Tax=Bifidobacterium oedipodis TaxID=2675322 RepID=A0A7Y0ESQ7_9BIFI|nr:ROK family transcriptional regulator [Bifidobacterium sp. DSM 109957]NMM94646.1 NagC family transcriptional regulator [Bifidobacterium sp. DSM 109957]